MQRILVTGSNRGIGLEFVRQLSARGDQVFAAARNPENSAQLMTLCHQYPDRVIPIVLDVADQASVDAAFEGISAQTGVLDILINNAGIYPSGERLGKLTREQLRATFEVNTIGPLMIVQTLLPLLRAASDAKVINLSTGMASIADVGYGGYYSYRGSKAALNMISRVLSFELRSMGISVLAVNPGWVQTDMGGQGAPVRVEQSVRGMLRLIDELTLAQSGSFVDYTGNAESW